VCEKHKFFKNFHLIVSDWKVACGCFTHQCHAWLFYCNFSASQYVSLRFDSLIWEYMIYFRAYRVLMLESNGQMIFIWMVLKLEAFSPPQHINQRSSMSVPVNIILFLWSAIVFWCSHFHIANWLLCLFFITCSL